MSPIFLRELAYQHAGMLTLGLSSLLFGILNDACTLLSLILTGCSFSVKSTVSMLVDTG